MGPTEGAIAPIAPGPPGYGPGVDADLWVLWVESEQIDDWLVGWLWTKHHILLGPRRYFTSDPPLVVLSPCSKGGQGEGEADDFAHQP